LKYLNVNCQLKEGLFCKIETRISEQKKRESRRRQQAAGSRE